MVVDFYIENTCREEAGREGRREGGRAGGRESTEGAFGIIRMREDRASPAPRVPPHPVPEKRGRPRHPASRSEASARV